MLTDRLFANEKLSSLSLFCKIGIIATLIAHTMRTTHSLRLKATTLAS
jgi:hypothetical protein